MACVPLQRRGPPPTRHHWRGHLRGRPRTRAGRSQALLTARRHRHRRVNPAHLVVHHVEEDRRGHKRTRARRQGWTRVRSSKRSSGHASWRPPWWRSARVTGVRPLRNSPQWMRHSDERLATHSKVSESVDVLQGHGPSDVRELTVALARIMLELVDIHVDPATCGLRRLSTDDSRPRR